MTKEERILRVKVDALVCREHLKGDMDADGFCVVKVERNPDNPEGKPSFKRVVFPGSESGPTY